MKKLLVDKHIGKKAVLSFVDVLSQLLCIHVVSVLLIVFLLRIFIIYSRQLQCQFLVIAAIK